LKQKSGGRIAARFVCGLGGSPFLYPLEPYRWTDTYGWRKK